MEQKYTSNLLLGIQRSDPYQEGQKVEMRVEEGWEKVKNNSTGQSQTPPTNTLRFGASWNSFVHSPNIT